MTQARVVPLLYGRTNNDDAMCAAHSAADSTEAQSIRWSAGSQSVHSMAGCEYAPELVERLGARTNGASRPAEIETAKNETLDSPPRLLPTDSSFPALSCRRQEVARWVSGHITGRWMPTPERIVAVSKGRHGVRPVAVTILCEIQRLRQNTVPIGTLLVLMLLTRLITRTGARSLAVPGAVVLLLITPLAALSTSPWVLAALLLCREGPQDCSSVR